MNWEWLAGRWRSGSLSNPVFGCDWIYVSDSRYRASLSSDDRQPASLSSGRIPRGMCSHTTVTFVVPPLSDSKVTAMVISPEKAGSVELKVIAWTILFGGSSSTKREVKLSSFSAVLPRKTCSDGGIEERHPISSADPGIEAVDFAGHLSGWEPEGQGCGVGERSIESFVWCFDYF